MLNNDINLFLWDDYTTTSKEGFILTYNTSLSAELPIRDIFGEQRKDFKLKDPNIETSTFGYYDCLNLKERDLFVKRQKKYIFFLTKYKGINEEYKDKILITGMMTVVKIKDMYGRIESCFNKATSNRIKSWWAFWGPMKFLSLEDALEVTPELLERWGFEVGDKVKKSTFDLNDEITEELLEYFDSKEDYTSQYIEEIKMLTELIDGIEEDI